MKFKFSLQKILEHRKTQEDVAQRDLQEALYNLQTEINKLEKLKQDLADCYPKRFSIQTGTSPKAIADLVSIDEYMKGQALRIEVQMTKVKSCEKLVEERREILRQRAVEYKIIDKLKEKKFIAFKEETSRQEQKEFDDLAIIRRGRNKNI